MNFVEILEMAFFPRKKWLIFEKENFQERMAKRRTICLIKLILRRKMDFIESKMEKKSKMGSFSQKSQKNQNEVLSVKKPFFKILFVAQNC